MGGTVMKATDLMIGDWVLINNIPHKIQAIDSINAEIQADDEIYYVGEDRCHSEDKIEGIPITPEILERNGFNPETFLTAEWKRKVYFKEFPGCVVEPDDSGKYIFGTTIYWDKKDGDGSPIDWGTIYESRICNLQYVHELQHALRLCKLDELVDNFKV